MSSTKEQKIKALQEQIVDLQSEIEELEKPEEFYVIVKQHEEHNWYETGFVYKVFSETKHDGNSEFYPLVNNTLCGVNPLHVVIISDKIVEELLDNTFDIRGRK